MVPKAAAVAKQLQKFGRLYNEHEVFGRTTHAEIYAAGTKTVIEPELAALRQQAHTLLQTPTLATFAAAPIDVLAAAEIMASRVDRTSLFDAIVVARGALDAVQVALRASQLGLGSDGNYTLTCFVVTDDRRRYMYREERWATLRHAVCAASDEAYRAALAFVSTRWAQLDAADHTLLAYLFPDQPWANVLLSALSSKADVAQHAMLLSSITEVAALQTFLALGGSPHVLADHALDLIQVFAEADLLPIFTTALTQVLVRPKHGPLLKTQPRMIVEAIACWRTTTAAEVLAPYAANAVLGPLVLGYFRDAPELNAVLAGKTGKRSATIERVIATARRPSQPAGDAPMAAISDVPSVLRNRTWRLPIEELGAPIELTMLVDQEFVRLPRPVVGHEAALASNKFRDATEAELAAWHADIDGNRSVYADYKPLYSSHEIVRIPAADGIRVWNAGDGVLLQKPLQWVALHGLAILPGFAQRSWLDYDTVDGYLEAVLSLVSPRIAPEVAKAADRKHTRHAAYRWLVAHADIAALGLLPNALGQPGVAQRQARAVLRQLALVGHRAAVEAAAARYGDAAALQIQALLDGDPLRLGTKAPKMPAFLRLGELAPVQLRNDATLDDAACTALVEMLQVVVSDTSYPGLAQICAHCTAQSLGAFALDLLEQWVLGDLPGRHEWMLFAVVHFPSEAGTRRLVDLARQWARKNAAKTERLAQALSALGTDVALQTLAHIADTTRYDPLRKTVAALVHEAAAARGLSADELADRVVPDVGLDSQGRLTLSFGSRTFVVVLDEALTPHIREQTEAGLGPIATALPRPNKTDDAALATSARERFAALKQDLGAIAQRTLRRFERAMVDGRLWSVGDFATHIVAHPLLTHIARRLLWKR